MIYLVDSQSFIWYVDQDQYLSPAAHATITDSANGLVISAASILPKDQSGLSFCSRIQILNGMFFVRKHLSAAL